MKTTLIPNILKAALAAIVLTFSIGLTSCNKDTTAANDTDALYTATLPDADETASDVTDATFEQPCAMKTPDSDNRRLNDFGVRVLRRMLKLSDEQKQQIRNFHQQHEDCFKSAREALRASEKAILEQYKPQYQAIRDNLKNGSIDTATAKQQFKDLTVQLREALKNNPDRAVAKEAFKNCRETFYQNVRSILTPEQQAILDEWIALHKR